MSSNNQLLIFGYRSFRAYDVPAEGEYTEKTCGPPIFETDNLREAIHKAQEYIKDNVVEYNYYFIDL